MAFLFRAPKLPKSPEAPEPPRAPPQVDEARQSLEQRDKLRRRRGRASTILTNNAGEVPAVGTKTLTGQ